MDWSKLTEASQNILNANIERGFDDLNRNVGEGLMLITSELSEALEADRKGRKFDQRHKKLINASSNPIDFKGNFEFSIKDTYEDEMADALIRILDESARKGVDIGWHVEQKLKYNAMREHKHGGKAY